MKKLFLYFILLLTLKATAQNVTFSSLTPYNGAMDSVRFVGILKSGNVWTNRTFYYSDVVSKLFKYTDTSAAFSSLRSFVQNNFALLSHSHVISDVTGLQGALNGKLSTSDSAAMLDAYRAAIIANAALIGGKLAKTDTASMLSPYAKLFQVPTNNNQLSNGAGYITSSALSTKVNYSDTSSMLSNYLQAIIQNKASIVSNTSAIATKVNISDTANMLHNYLLAVIQNAANISTNTSALSGKLNISDTSTMLNAYRLAIIQNSANIATNTSNIASNTTAIAGKLSATGGDLTGTTGTGYIGFPAQSSNPSTPTSGFKFFADPAGSLSWVTSSGYTRSIKVRSQTQNNTYYLPDSSGQTIATIQGGLGRMVLSDNAQHANTGSTTENTVYTGTIKANSLGANGTAEIRLLVTWPNNANNKIFKVKVNGTVILNVTATSSSVGNWMVRFSNRNSTSSQVYVTSSGAGAGQVGFGTAAPTPGVTTAAWDTTTDLTITVTITNGTSTDSPTLESIQVITFYKD